MKGKLDFLYLNNKPIAFVCPLCFGIIITRKKSWTRMKCPYCRSYIYRSEIKRFYPVRR